MRENTSEQAKQVKMQVELRQELTEAISDLGQVKEVQSMCEQAVKQPPPALQQEQEHQKSAREKLEQIKRMRASRAQKSQSSSSLTLSRLTESESCILILATTPPTKETLSSFDNISHSAYIRYSDQLFYVNKKTHELIEYKLSKEAIEQFDNEIKKEMKPEDGSKILTPGELLKIRTLVKFFPEIKQQAEIKTAQDSKETPTIAKDISQVSKESQIETRPGAGNDASITEIRPRRFG